MPSLPVTHGHSTHYCPKVNPGEFSTSCETRHNLDLGTFQVLHIGPITIHADRRQLSQIHKAIGDCLAADPTPTGAQLRQPDQPVLAG